MNSSPPAFTPHPIRTADPAEAPFRLKLFWGSVFAIVALVFTVLGGIDGVKTVKSFCGIPLTFVCLFVLLGFLRYMAKRPRTVSGEYVYEEEVANAPDNGQPMEQKSKILGKLGW